MSQDMTDAGRLNAWGALINSALYLAGLMAAGLVGGFHAVVAGSLSAAACALMAYAWRLPAPHSAWPTVPSILSWLLGGWAGIDLLARYLG